MTSLLLITIVPMFLLSIILRIRRKPYPPGPMGFPIIGNLLMMGQMTHHGLAKLAQHYGGLFHLKMGFVHIMVVSSPDEAQQVLSVQDKVFSNRPTSLAIDYLTYNRADMVFTDCGPFWRKIRKLCVMGLFSCKRVVSWQSVREEVGHMVQAIEVRAESQVIIRDHLFKLSLNVIYRAAFGSKFQEGQDEFVAILEEFSKLFGAFNIADYIPFLARVDPNGLNKRLIKARSALDHFIDKIIDYHIHKKNVITNGHAIQDDEVEDDMVDDLLKFYTEGVKAKNLDDLHKSIKITRDNIKAIIMDLMFGGTETITTVAEWVMTELLCNPQHMKRVQQELTYVVGLTRRVEESDLDKLTFFRCCIKETLRMHPPIPLLLHETIEDAFINGYYIPKQTRVLINTWALGRNQDSWSDANMFKPERFLEENAPDFKGANFEFIPFGSGRRSCPGMSLAIYALELCMANLLHSFKWELPDGVKPCQLNKDETFGLTISKTTQLIVVPSPRKL